MTKVEEKQIEKKWTKAAQKQLLGKKIVKARYMSKHEASSLGWFNRCVVIELDDGNIIYPSSDDEGNEAGSLFTNDEVEPILPVLR